MENKIVWQALEYEHKEKTPDWYWAVGVIALSISIASIIYNNYLFAIFIILATITLIMFRLRKPEEFTVEINKKGVKIKDDFFPYKILKAFWIDQTDPSQKKLILHSEKPLMPMIILSVGDHMEEEIKIKLSEHQIKEEEMREPVSHKIMEYLGF